MTLPRITYPFDPTGISAANVVTGEQHIVTEANFRDFYFIVPQYGPIFAGSVVINYSKDNSSRLLVEGQDFYLALPFIGATRSIGKPIYGAITFNNLIVDGVVSIRYQTLGGDWLFDDQLILTTIANQVYNPRIVTWEQVTGIPNQFPVINHVWKLVDMVGEKEVVDALQSIEQALLAGATDQYKQHLYNLNNPHRTDKTQVGLDKVENLLVMTTPEVDIDPPLRKYLTFDVFKRYVISHLSDFTVTKIAKAIADALAAYKTPVSNVPGNLITTRDDGLYYGLVAPDDVKNLYLDYVYGTDTNPGTKASPMKTIQGALNRGPAGIVRSIFLKEKQKHIVLVNNDAAVLRGGVLYIQPYGPLVDALPLVVGDDKLASNAARNLDTEIVAGDFNTNSDASGNKYQIGIAFYPTQNGVIRTIGVTLRAGSPSTNDPFSGYEGSFVHPDETGSWAIYYARIILPNASSRFFSSSCRASNRLQLLSVKLSGPGKILDGGSINKVLDYPGVPLAVGTSRETAAFNYIIGGDPFSGIFRGFQTNLVPVNASGPDYDPIPYVSNVPAPTPAPSPTSPPPPAPTPPPPVNMPGVLSWVTTGDQNVGDVTVGKTFTSTVTLLCTGGIGNTPYNVSVGDTNGTIVTTTGQVGSLDPGGTATVTITTYANIPGPSSVAFTLPNSSNGSTRTVNANAVAVIVPPPPPPAPTPNGP